jgi:glutamine amidotransferase
MGLTDPIREVVSKGTPFLGICIGMQLLFDHSEEDGGTPCLGTIPGQVERFRPSDPLDKIPQMGWNTIKIKKPHPLFSGIEDESEFYFVHSYYPSPSNPEDIYGETEYADARFASVAGRKNLFATQFHPERSGRIGLRILENFCRWEGTC